MKKTISNKSKNRASYAKINCSNKSIANVCVRNLMSNHLKKVYLLNSKMTCRKKLIVNWLL